MPSVLQQSEEPRYDAETLRRVTRLAQELQTRSQDTLTAGEIEAAGAEVGLEPQYVQEALRQVAPPKPVPTKADLSARRALMAAYRKAWWAGGWALPMLVLMLVRDSSVGAGLFMLGWGLYAAVGIILGALAANPGKSPAEAASQGTEGISRADFVEALTALREALESRQPPVHAALSVEVEGFLGFREGPLPAAADGSFTAFHEWACEVLRRHGGTPATGGTFDLAAHFKDETAAVQAAHALQTEIAQFNASGNRLSEPFTIRCAVAGGRLTDGASEAALRQEAEHMRRLAAPGDIVVNTESAAEAVVVLGGVKAVAQDPDGERLFSWRAAGAD